MPLFSFLLAPARYAHCYTQVPTGCRHSDSPLPGVRRETGRYTDLPGFKNLEGL